MSLILEESRATHERLVNLQQRAALGLRMSLEDWAVASPVRRPEIEPLLQGFDSTHPQLAALLPLKYQGRLSLARLKKRWPERLRALIRELLAKFW